MARNRFPTVMKTVAALTGVATGAMAALYAAFGESAFLTAAIICGTTFYHFAMRLLLGALIPELTRSVNPESDWFRLRGWEGKLHKLLRVKSWKKNLPTYDPGQFDLGKNSLEQVVRNMCNAELVHEGIMVCSFVPLLFAIPFGDFWVFMTTSLLAAMYDGIFVTAQRYNRPRLMGILKKKEARP